MVQGGCEAEIGAHIETQAIVEAGQARRAFALTRTSLVAISCALLAQPAFAQTASAGDPAVQADTTAQDVPATDTGVVEPVEASSGEAAQKASDIVVTGTRIRSNGFAAPTPTSVVGEEQIQANAQPNVFTTIAQLPSLQGSTGSTINTFSTSSGQQGLSAFALRGLGSIRTLTLIDGQRVVPAYYNGTADVSQFPQLLIKRVDVVNGGASASYGSDAVGGVVNFITDTRFVGIKGNLQGGISKYEDNKSRLAQLAVGTNFLDERLHVVASGEYAKDDGVGPGDFGIGMANGRDWFRQQTQINLNAETGGNPQYLIRSYAQPYNYTRYGVINNGPLQGIAFDANGNPFQFEYGSNGVPARNASGAVIGCFPGVCIGGDTSGNVDSGRSLQSAVKRLTGYGRVGYDFADNNEIYVSYSYGRVQTSNQPVNGQQRPGLTIQCANPFVPQSVRNQCATAGITQFGYGTSGYILPNTRVETDRRQYRVVVGVNGSIDLGTEWNYDAYYQRGINRIAVDVSNISLNQRFLRAIDATTINGQIVCRDAVARASGCQPINILSGAAPSAAALEYVQPANGPYQRMRITQDVASANFSGSPFDLWAGPVSIAFGAEWRREYYTVRADPYGAGTLAEPNNADYPADPILTPAQAEFGGNWYAGNYKNGSGDYNVKEAYLEADVPLFNADWIGRGNVNGAVRVTDYSTSGVNWTWKIGGTWNTPFEGLRIRGVTSKDVRAPNLSELYAAPVSTRLPQFFDRAQNKQVIVLQSVGGNPDLKPEVARNTSIGFALSGNPLLPGFGLSVDWYKIKVKGLIGTLGAQQIVDYCYDNVLPTCDAFNLNNTAGENFINVVPFNFGYIKTNGWDIEASYRWQRPLGLAGSFTLRGLATHIDEYVTAQGLPNTIPTDTAGVNQGTTPNWKFLTVQNYTTDRFSLYTQQRWFSDGLINNHNWIECQTTCPTGRTALERNLYPTIEDNSMKGAFYFDIGGSFKINNQFEAYGKIDNLFDRDPVLGLFANPSLYDMVGRMYRAGVRFKF
ncbi:TonB-dependent receptor [Sphingomonas piscis]|uniref:TonB-dependent receptor n=2 Tax=Sphingomonas piscis TaxID=2714943 RepID=A0A6G7YTM5_9SPHN|nr:TonB-dependent receptor [Sphingomonas piscis]